MRVKVYRADPERLETGQPIWNLLSPEGAQPHAQSLQLVNVSFEVNPMGLAVCRRSGRRWTCGWAVGDLATDCQPIPQGAIKVVFRPIELDDFYGDYDGQLWPLQETIDRAWFDEQGRMWVPRNAIKEGQEP